MTAMRRWMGLFVVSSCAIDGLSFPLNPLSTQRVFLQNNCLFSTSNRNNNEFTFQRNQLASDLLKAAREIGQVGKSASTKDRQRLDELAQELRPFSDPQPARNPLCGTHQLVYSGSDSGPTAGLIGPFVGRVTQVFWNETVY